MAERYAITTHSTLSTRRGAKPRHTVFQYVVRDAVTREAVFVSGFYYRSEAGARKAGEKDIKTLA